MNEPLAIVGMACRLPGADGLDAFWDLVVAGRTAWGTLPESRLARDLYFHPEKSRVGKSYSEMGGLVSERPVDPAVCPITPAMIERFDVAHHIFLEVASLACRDAGLDPFAMPADRRTGVYVGHTGGSTRIGDLVYGTGIDEAAALLAEVDVARGLLGPDAAAEVAAEVTATVRRRYPGREPARLHDLGAIGAAKIVQEALGLDGPYLVVDAACASSLQAMAIGARALLEGGIDQAIVGGASYCKSDSLVLFSAAQSVSNAGSCPFGADADGLITAEGYVALVIKKLSRAIADGDRIRAVIRGLGVASDGKGKSLWAPRQEGQVLAVERAYPDPADIARIEYIEAHATSTQVGDATELAALSRLMGRHLPPGRQIPIGSVKANIGHTLETAGIASLVKVVLAMEHGLIPPGSTCTRLNAEFDWRGGPFRVPLEPVAWPAHADGAPRCAAVNAFGIGGLNVHVALAEHVPTRLRTSSDANDTPDEPIAIVGAGCVLPGALSLDAFYDRLDRGEIAIGPVPPDRWLATRAVDRTAPRTWHTTADLGGFVRGFAYDWRRHKVPPKQIAAANPLQFMLLEAADAALADAGGPQAGLDRTRTGVVVGTLFGGDFANQLQIGLRLPETGKILRTALQRRGVAAADIDRVVEGYEKKVLEKLPALVDETGSFTSSTLASRLTKTFDLMGGALALDSGDCSSVSALSAAVDMLRQGSCDAVLCAAGERSMDLMAYEGRSLAGRLAAEPRSVLDGHASGGDVPGEGAVVLVLKRLADARAAGNTIRGVIRGVSLGSGRSTAEVARRVIREAIEQSRVAPAAVRAVEVATAAASASAGAELAALGGQYGAAGDAPVAGALDGLLGHTGAAAGAAALLKLSRSLVGGSLPGSAAVHVGRTHGLAASAVAVAIPAVDAAGYRAGCVTVVQDTQVGHVVLDNGLPMPAEARPAACGTVPAAATQPADRTPGRPLVAALFPGQGSQYADMFRSLVEETPEARAALGRLDALARACGQATLAEIAWRPDNGLGTRIWDTQWGMYLGDLLAWGVLQDMGFAPDLVASHSFGEFPSLAAVGAWTAEDGCRATLARATAVERHGPRNGAMLSVIADRATVRKAIEPFTGQAWVCAENAPEQSVIGGIARVVDAVEVILEAARVKSKRLAVPSPFHTPLLAAAADELAATIHGLRITAPRIATFSSTTAAQLTSPAEIQESLIRQMTETVRWVEVVERLYAAGARTFVEVGPSGVLTGLTRRILEGRAGVTFVQFDQRGRSPREHLARLREQLAAAGALAARAGSDERSAMGGPTTPDAARERGPRMPQPADPATAGTPPTPGRIVSFDATARRRERNRSGGAARPAAPPAATAQATTPAVGPSSAGAGGVSPGAGGASPGAGGASPGAGGASPGSRSLPARSPRGSHNGTQVLEPVAATATVARPLPDNTTRFLEDIVADLLAEAGVEPPLARAGAAHPGVRAFLDAADHLFEVGAAEHAAVLQATSSAALCDLLARTGGKARWLARRPVAPQPAVPVVSTAVAAGPAAEEIEAFLIDFVVEQTGYPREIVELGADLEADLGIDSIRKAQLFGEIGQKYGLTADDSVSLDEFPTLRHLLDYMLPRVGGGRGGSALPAGREAVHQENGHAAYEGNGHAANGHADNSQLLNSHAANGHAGNGHVNPVHTPAVQPAPAVTPAPVAAGLAMELETFLIDFVVEQTGYPREIVELGADLEADLGIDSIRKAQLFGEIGQKYGLTADDSVSLDEFPTLRHLLDYMLPRVGGGRGGSVVPAVREAVHQENGHAAYEGNGHAANGHAGNSQLLNSHAANGHAIAGRAAAAPSAPAVTPAPVAAGLAMELETFLIDFVVEQTGYPREIVELGADLEADLGIDSIRKAQLFGEIGQKYGLTADDSVSLDEFPTLRHLLDYMLPRVGATRGGSTAAASVAQAARSQPTHSAAFVRGAERGRDHAAAIAAWARQMVATGVAAAGEAVDPAVAEDLAGVAAGADVEPAIVRAAFAEPARALGGCDAVIVAPADAAAPRGAIVCLGRHADPAVRRFETPGLCGGLVGVKGLPGAVFGWSDAGLVAVAAQGCDGAATLVCEQILTTCRSVAEAQRAVAGLAAAPRGLVVAAIAGGGFEVTAAGRVEPIVATAVRTAARSPLARVLLADGARTAEAAAADLLREVPGVRDALAATCGWIALGAVDGRLAALAGGPAGGAWAPPAHDLGAGWQAVAAAQAAVVPTDGPAASRADVTRRYGLVLREAAPLQAVRRLVGERVLVVNAGPLAESFSAAIRAAGGTPLAVECGSAEEASAAVERAEESGVVRHLVVVAPRADGGDWLPARARSVVAPFFACQRWIVLRGKAGDLTAATLTGVTALGGDFGLDAPIGAAAGGAIAGLFKGVAREFSGLHVRVLDAPATLPAADVAAAAVAEMQDGAGPVETALVGGRRMNVVPCDVPPRATTPLAALARGSAWIVTGGARGVTAACCRELGRRHGLRLALCGSTVPVAVEPAWLGLDDAGLRDLKGRVMLEAKARGEDPRAAWKRIEKSIEIEGSLARFRAAGVDARYYACNLADAAAVRAAVGRVTADIGPIRGIVHGAGFEAACRFEKKTLEGLEATLGPKCAGLEHLLAAVDPATLEALVAFGSTSGRLGGHGQADYALANDMLAKIVGGLRHRRPHLRGTVFHWHAWDEVGMAARPESRFVLEQFGLKFMPLAEGVRRFMDEIEAGLPDAEVLVTEPAMCPDAVGGPTAATAAAPPRGSLVAGVERRDEATWVTFALDPTSDRFLLDHKQYGRPLLPAVMGLELLAQAACAAGGCGAVAEIRDFAVERPIGFPVDQPRSVRVEVVPQGTAADVRAWGVVPGPEGRPAGDERLHLRGLVLPAAEPISAVAEPPPMPLYPTSYREDSPLWHGASMRTLNGLFLDRSGGWARLTAAAEDDAAAPRGAAGWTVPIALLDGCVMACGLYSYVMCGQRMEVPLRIDRFRIVARPRAGEKCDARLRFREQSPRETTYDCVLFGADGRPLLAIDGLHMAVMAPERSRSA